MDGTSPLGGIHYPNQSAPHVPPSSRVTMPTWVAVVLFVFILALGYWFWRNYFAGTVRDIGSGQTLSEAPRGKVVAGFPKELIVEDDPTVRESYSISYAESNTKQPVVSYRSAKTLSENVSMFSDYLRSDGWRITHHANAEELPVTFFYAYKDLSEVNITMQSDDDGVLVTIAYAEHADSGAASQ